MPLAPLPIPRWVPRFLLWTCLAAAILWFADPFLLKLTPRDITNHRDYVINPGSKLYGPLYLRRIGYGWGWKTASDIPTQPRVIALRTDYNSQFYGEVATRYGRANHYAARMVNGQANPVAQWQAVVSETSLSKWLAAMDVDVSRDDVKAEIAELLKLMSVNDFIAEHEPITLAVSVSRAGGGPEIAPSQNGRPWVIAFDAVIWAAGAWAVTKKPRHRAAGVLGQLNQHR